MKILGVDTSSKFLSIALSEDKDIIKEESHLLDRKHASELVPKIKELLKKSKVPINKVDAFIIGLGPGSFTGLRIGVSAIKGFGIASGNPVSEWRAWMLLLVMSRKKTNILFL
mgnify:CR=1 FL=1